MIVSDAGILANAVGDDQAGGSRARAILIAQGPVSIPHLADIEAVTVLRRRWLRGTLDSARFSRALNDLARLPLSRHAALPYLQRVFELRANVSAYDAVYVALAETLRCALATTDARLSRATGIRCPIIVVGDFAR